MQHRDHANKYLTQHGYSLIELMIVVAIIGVMALAVNFSYSPANARLKAAARDLYSNMQTAKIEAVKRSEDWGIIFNTTNNSYAICAYNTGTSTCTGDNTTIDLDSYNSSIQFGFSSDNEDVAGNSPPPALSTDGISFASNALYFDFKGMSGNLGFTYLVNNKDTSFAVGTKSLAGVVKIRKWSGSAWE